MLDQLRNIIKTIKYLGQNYNQRTIYQTAKAVFEGIFIALNTYIGKEIKISLSCN